MKYTVAFLAFFILAVTPAPVGYAVRGMDIFNTGPFDCSTPKQVRETEWVNDLGDLRIYNAVVWVGASGGTVADIGTIVYSGESILFHQNWDHYAEPTGIHTDRLDLSPNYIKLKQGDAINMAYWCEIFDNELDSQAHIIVTVWYTK